MSRLAAIQIQGYCGPVAAKSATGILADPGKGHRRTSAHIPAVGAFFVPATQRYGGCAWDTFGCAGTLCPRSANPRTVAPIRCLAATGDGSTDIGATPMQNARIASAARARAHRKMAISALKSDSSLATLLKRYRHHSAKARRLEGGAV